MSKAWSARSAAERERLEADFEVRHGVDLLLNFEDPHGEPDRLEPGRQRVPGRLGTGPRPAFARLFRALHFGGSLTAELRVALAADPSLRDDFSLLLERTALRHLPRAAAAASIGALVRREAGGCTVRIVSSRSGGGQVYLLIELPEGGAQPSSRGADSARSAVEEARGPSPGTRRESGGPEAATPGRLVVKTAEGTFLMEDLPPPETRTIRLVKAADDPLVRAVGEPGERDLPALRAVEGTEKSSSRTASPRAHCRTWTGRHLERR